MPYRTENNQVAESIAEYRNYRVKNGDDARQIGLVYLEEIDLVNVIDFGLPEIDDRYNIWRLPLKAKNGDRIGEIVIDAKTTFIDRDKSTVKEILENRLLGRTKSASRKKQAQRHLKYLLYEIQLV